MKIDVWPFLYFSQFQNGFPYSVTSLCIFLTDCIFVKPTLKEILHLSAYLLSLCNFEQNVNLLLSTSKSDLLIAKLRLVSCSYVKMCLEGDRGANRGMGLRKVEYNGARKVVSTIFSTYISQVYPLDLIAVRSAW